MANLTLEIGGHSYPVTCPDGEEDNVLSLAAMVDEQVRRASSGGTGMTEVRGLLYAALFLADSVKEQQAQNGAAPAPDKSDADSLPEGAIQGLERLAERVETLADTLEKPEPNA
ncbi:cell division protein ZapA [Alterisphingorhabdus coralli]|uniref:Cell division protein ZapA n=1 Tax=Alterisphingorhabdus coralli TaxID=3071408 RepID=A0AA97F403_9SPHN|nr:cell division protein ZapA [Parasphingorhabdus sp. SCSIO 66989]WOE73904.1 cell division protein ZapA [Parasphingorhabdus sp. SCSIO 66989]